MRTDEQKKQFEYVVATYTPAWDKYLAKGLQALTETERTLLAVWVVDAEVNNGGFDQYFFNSSGDLAPETPSALERIGAPRAAALLRRAIERFPDAQPASTQTARHDQLEALRLDDDESIFEDLDESWFVDIEDLELQLAHYLRRQTA